MKYMPIVFTLSLRLIFVAFIIFVSVGLARKEGYIAAIPPLLFIVPVVISTISDWKLYKRNPQDGFGQDSRDGHADRLES